MTLGTEPVASASHGRLSPRRLVWCVIGIGTTIRLVSAVVMGLGVDESYAVASARTVSLSYFDHPPLSFWLAHASARVFGSESHLAVRLPFILLFAVTTWFIYQQTAHAFGEREGWLAALFLNLSPVFSFSTAGWVLPDGPLMCALAAAGYCLVRVLLDPAGGRLAGRWWVGAGLCTGIALLSKYQAVLFVVGVGVFLAFRPTQRRWLARPEPYAGMALALLLFAPVLVWNAQHAWVSFAFQGGRAGHVLHPTWLSRVGALATTLGAQAAWLLPWVWLPLVWVLVLAFARRPHQDRRLFFATIGVIPIALFALASLGGRPSLPHWPASGYLFLFPLLGAAVIERVDRFVERRIGAPAPAAGVRGSRRGHGDRRLRPVLAWAAWSTASYILLLVAGVSAVATGWHTRLLPTAMRRKDPTLEAVDWDTLRPGLDSLGVLGRPRTFVASTSWIQAGKAAYALGPNVPVLCLCHDPHQFAFQYDQHRVLGEDAVILDRLPARHDIYALYGPYFQSIVPMARITVRRAHTPVFDIGVYIASDFKQPFPVTAMPAAALATVP